MPKSEDTDGSLVRPIKKHETRTQNRTLALESLTPVYPQFSGLCARLIFLPSIRALVLAVAGRDEVEGGGGP